MQDDNPEHFCKAAAQVLEFAARAPRLAAQLLASGSLAAFVEGLPEDEQACWHSLVQAATRAVLAVERAASAALESQPNSSRSALRQAATAMQQVKAVQLLEAALDAGISTAAYAQLAALHHTLPPATQLALALQAHWQEEDAAPKRQQAVLLGLAQAAATRQSCAHLACPNLEATGKRGKRCSGCNVARYCSRACSVADWQAGHRHACKLLAAARQAAEVQQAGS